MALLVIALIALFGTLAFRVGWRGEQIDDHPICRRCGFDLTGKPVDSWRCGECGANLLDSHNTQIGHRRRGIGWIFNGSLLLCLALLAAGLFTADKTQTIRWIEYAPVKWLLYEAQQGDVASCTELSSRIRNGKLTQSQLAITAAVALAIQGNSKIPWNPAWGDFIERERLAKTLTDAQWATYAQQACAGVFTLTVRPKVRIGDPLPYSITVSHARVAMVSILRVSVDEISFGFSDIPMDSIHNRSSATFGFGGTGSTISELNASDFPKDLVAGPHTVRVLANFKIGEPTATSAVTPLFSGTIDLKNPVLVVPMTESTAKGIPDPTVKDSIRKALTTDLQCFSNQTSWGSSVTVSNTPVAVSFKVYVVMEGKEYELGAFACPAVPMNASYSWGMGKAVPFKKLFSTSQLTAGPPNTSPPPRVTVILRSSPEPAINSTDISNFWEGTIELKNVPVNLR